MRRRATPPHIDYKVWLTELAKAPVTYREPCHSIMHVMVEDGFADLAEAACGECGRVTQLITINDAGRQKLKELTP